MKLEELKALMGIDAADTSQDAILGLYLDAAIETLRGYATGYDWETIEPMPGPMKLGILRYVELSQDRKSNGGVISESIGGISTTYANTNTNDNEYFKEVFSFWKPYRKRGVPFHPAIRKDSGARKIELPTDFTVGGTFKA